MVTIRQAKDGEADWVITGFNREMHYSRTKEYFEGLIEAQAEGKLVFLIAEADGDYAGHCKVNDPTHQCGGL